MASDLAPGRPGPKIVDPTLLTASHCRSNIRGSWPSVGFKQMSVLAHHRHMPRVHPRESQHIFSWTTGLRLLRWHPESCGSMGEAANCVHFEEYGQYQVTDQRLEGPHDS